MSKKLFEELFFNHKDYLFIDVRSPSEFKKGHIPGAYNIPLFSDQLRALVGAIYVQEGKEKAVHFALERVSPQFSSFAQEAQGLYQKSKKTLVVYCARGGMRSGALTWLFTLFNLPVIQLERGYKAYRNWAMSQFSLTRQVNLLSGKTGAGKTECLLRWLKQGRQIIDLEGLADHKGSVFGGDKDTQATQQQFENDLAWQWAQLDSKKEVWLESESRKIGAVIIPEPIWLQMKHAPVYVLECSQEERLDRIMREYGVLPLEFLLRALAEIKDHLGSERYFQVKILMDNGEIKEAFIILLAYYDKKYDHSLQKKGDFVCIG
jgi:tRNA 2-selenouridine synthase